MKKSTVDLIWIFILAILAFTVGPICTANSATLAWDASEGATGYKIYYQAQGTTDRYSVIVESGTQQEMEPLNMLPGVTYEIYATAFNSVGESGPSNTVVYTTPEFIPTDNPAPMVIVAPNGIMIRID